MLLKKQKITHLICKKQKITRLICLHLHLKNEHFYETDLTIYDKFIFLFFLYFIFLFLFVTHLKSSSSTTSYEWRQQFAACRGFGFNGNFRLQRAKSCLPSRLHYFWLKWHFSPVDAIWRFLQLSANERGAILSWLMGTQTNLLVARGGGGANVTQQRN